jgi:hypothetical protein
MRGRFHRYKEEEKSSFGGSKKKKERSVRMKPRGAIKVVDPQHDHLILVASSRLAAHLLGC